MVVAVVVAATAVATVVVTVAAAVAAVASDADQRPDTQQSPLQAGSFYSSSRI
jgi:hypothetical protein